MFLFSTQANAGLQLLTQMVHANTAQSQKGKPHKRRFIKPKPAFVGKESDQENGENYHLNPFYGLFAVQPSPTVSERLEQRQQELMALRTKQKSSWLDSGHEAVSPERD